MDQFFNSGRDLLCSLYMKADNGTPGNKSKLNVRKTIFYCVGLILLVVFVAYNTSPSLIRDVIVIEDENQPSIVKFIDKPYLSPEPAKVIDRDCTNQERLRNLAEVCRSMYSDDYIRYLANQRSTYNMLWVDEKHKVLYCDVPKAASTSWKMLLARLTGNKTVDQPNFKSIIHFNMQNLGFRMLNSYNNWDEIHYRLNNYFKFAIVRNPIDRLLSAFYDKFGNKDMRFFALGKKIIQELRKNASEESLKMGQDVKLHEFLHYVAHVDPNSDIHWRSMVKICHPCVIHYDYIGKVETVNRDAPEILSKFSGNIDLSIDWMHKGGSREVRKKVGKHSKFLKDLVEANSYDIKGLLRYYERDFKLFGYEFDKNTSVASCGLNSCC